MKTVIVSTLLALGLTDVLASRIKADHGFCLATVLGSGGHNGRPVWMWACDAESENQEWTYNASTGQIKATHGVCLDASQRNVSSGKVLMWACDTGNKNQQWTYDERTGQIKNKHGICLDAAQKETNGGRVQMYPCNTANLNQQWSIINVSDPVDKILKKSVPHTLDMVSLSALVYKTDVGTGGAVTVSMTGNKYKVTETLEDPGKFGKIWFAEFEEGKICALVTRGSYDTQTLLGNNMDWATLTIPGTKYKVMKGYQDHILAILEHNNNWDKMRRWLKSCSARGFTKLFTGHSLGGSVSVWLAIYFEMHQPTYHADYILTIGQPRLVQTFGTDKCPIALQSRNRAVRLVNANAGYVDAATLIPAATNPKEASCFESYSMDDHGNLVAHDDQWPNWSYGFVQNVFGWPLHKSTVYVARMEKVKAKVEASEPCLEAGTYCDKNGDWWGAGNCDKKCCHGSVYNGKRLRYECQAKAKPCLKSGSWCDVQAAVDLRIFVPADKCAECCTRDYKYIWWRFRHECK